MKVIVAGMPKTGTKSMNEALTRLGYKVYDVFENCLYLGEDFAKLLNDGWSTEDFRRMYEDVDAVVDYPAYFFWEEIHKAFPDAKIILTIRESEDSWAKSIARQHAMNESSVIFNFLLHFSPVNRKVARFWKRLFPTAFGIPPPSAFSFRKASDFNHDMMKRVYRAHNAYVRQTAPEDKLLVYNCKEGWEPLCNFLGMPVRKEPFPHKNKNAELTQEMKSHPIVKKMMREAMIYSAVCLAAAVATGVVIYKYDVTGILAGLCARTETFLGKKLS